MGQAHRFAYLNYGLPGLLLHEHCRKRQQDEFPLLPQPEQVNPSFWENQADENQCGRELQELPDRIANDKFPATRFLRHECVERVGGS